MRTLELDEDTYSALERRAAAVGLTAQQWLREQLSEQMQLEADLESIDRGLADVEAGRVSDFHESMRRLADKHGLSRPA